MTGFKFSHPLFLAVHCVIEAAEEASYAGGRNLSPACLQRTSSSGPRAWCVFANTSPHDSQEHMRTGPSSPSLRASPIGRLRTTDPLPVFLWLPSFDPARSSSRDGSLRWRTGRERQPGHLPSPPPLVGPWRSVLFPIRTCQGRPADHVFVPETGFVRAPASLLGWHRRRWWWCSAPYGCVQATPRWLLVAGKGRVARVRGSRSVCRCTARAFSTSAGLSASILRSWMREESRRLVVLQEGVVSPVVPRPQGRPDPRPSIGPIDWGWIPNRSDRISDGKGRFDRGGDPGESGSGSKDRPGVARWKQRSTTTSLLEENERTTNADPSIEEVPSSPRTGRKHPRRRTDRKVHGGLVRDLRRKPCGRSRPEGSRPWTVHAWTFPSGSGAWFRPSGS